MNKHIKQNCFVHPCPLEGVVSLTCHSAPPAPYHVDNELDDIFFQNCQKHETGRENMLVNGIKVKIEKYFNRQ